MAQEETENFETAKATNVSGELDYEEKGKNRNYGRYKGASKKKTIKK